MVIKLKIKCRLEKGKNALNRLLTVLEQQSTISVFSCARNRQQLDEEWVEVCLH